MMTTYAETPEMTAFAEALVLPRHSSKYDATARMNDTIAKNATPVEGRHRGRPNTPDEILPSGGTRVTVKRVCDGCGKPVGDATDEEICAVIDGTPLPSVIDEHGCAR